MEKWYSTGRAEPAAAGWAPPASSPAAASTATPTPPALFVLIFRTSAARPEFLDIRTAMKLGAAANQVNGPRGNPRKLRRRVPGIHRGPDERCHRDERFRRGDCLRTVPTARQTY
ncbi:hypothetical protein GCM10010440_54550 [Kitasatospora cinereorecta]